MIFNFNFVILKVLMKTILLHITIVIIALFLLNSSYAVAQQSQEKSIPQIKTAVPDSLVADSSQTGNGKQKQLRKHKRDRFVDEDGDGINDKRCVGVGLNCGQSKCNQEVKQRFGKKRQHGRKGK